MDRSYDLVVASHLRWSFVWQRPQQLLSRLAAKRRILVVEEPVHREEGDAVIPTIEKVHDNVYVLAPRVPSPDGTGTPVWAPESAIAEQVQFGMRMLKFRETALWFYTPLPEFLIEAVDPDIIVYDVMDELANFKFAPSGLREQEARMLRRADVV